MKLPLVLCQVNTILYAFTPFFPGRSALDSGKCLLDLAGYDISQFPMTTICNGLSLDWPLEVAQNDGPNR